MERAKTGNARSVWCAAPLAHRQEFHGVPVDPRAQADEERHQLRQIQYRENAGIADKPGAHQAESYPH